jgi:hypothetical protein
MATTCLAHYNDFAKSSTAPLSGGNRNCPPTIRTGSGFFRRRFCRIFPSEGRWVMQMELGGWEASAAAQGLRRTFPSLSVAIAYAIDHGYTYRVVHVPDLVGSREAMPTLKFSHRGLEGRQHTSTS